MRCAGDTFPVGCAFDESIVHYKVQSLNQSSPQTLDNDIYIHISKSYNFT